MSKHRKKPVAASGQIQSAQKRATLPDSRARRMVWQLVGLLGASVVLGFAFNSSNPVGIRFNEADSETTSTRLTTEAPAPTVAAPTNRLASLPPLPQPPAENPKATRVIVPTPPSPPVENHTHAHTRQLTPASPVAPPTATTPTATAVSPPAPAPSTPQNPAPIHWNEAKPLVESGQAVLVDVRPKPVYDAGHIPGAISLPETSSPEEFTTFLNQHPTNATLILYCSSTSCSQSARVAGRLVTQYQRPSVKYMTGGYLEYQQLQAKPANP